MWKLINWVLPWFLIEAWRATYNTPSQYGAICLINILLIATNTT